MSARRPGANRSALRLQFFGGPTLWRKGERIMVSPYQAGLISIAVGTPSDRIPRATVQRHLWGDNDEKAVRHRLSQLIYQTNHRCGAKFIALEGEFVRVHRKLVGSDLDDLAEMIRSESLEEACDLLERGFLLAFPKSRTVALSKWIDGQHSTLRAGLREAALASWDVAAAEHNWTRAQVAAEVLLRLDPDEEVVLRRVMRARAMGGMVREAEAAYRSFAERTEPSGEWTPEPETRKLLKAVKATKPLPARRLLVSNLPELRIPFCGRADELAHLSDSLYHKPRGFPNAIVISGEAGIGKTRLVDEALQGAAFRGYRVIRANAAELEREIPLGPLLEGLNQSWMVPILRTLPDPWRSVLLSLLPQLHEGAVAPPQFAPAHSGNLSREVCEAFLRVFESIAQAEQTLLVLDDFQWADQASVAVLRFLLRRSSAGDLAVLFVYRQEELRGDSVVQRFIQELESEPETTIIRLGELNGPTARELARSVSSQELTIRQLDEIEAQAGGNPLFLTELAAIAPAKDAPRPSGRRVRVPPAIRQALGRRTKRLNATGKKLLTALAVLGQPATMKQLVQITGCTRHECVDAIEELHTLCLVTWTETGIAIRYNILQHAVYEDLSRPRRSMLHGLTAELLRSDSAEPPLDQVARHYFLGGDRQLAHAYAFEAVKGAQSKEALERLHHLEIAYEVSKGWRRSVIAVSLVRAYYRARRLAATVEISNEVLKRARKLSAPESIAIRFMVADARNLLGVDDTDSTLAELAVLDRMARGEGDEVLLAGIFDTTLRVLRRSGEQSRVAELVKTIRETEKPREPAAKCRILGAVALATLDRDPDAAIGFARSAMAVARFRGTQDESMLVLRAHIAALKANGLLATEEGRNSLANVVPWSQGHTDLASRVFLMIDLVGWHTSTGTYEVASRLLKDTDNLAESIDCPLVISLRELARGNLALARGDIATATSAFNIAGGRDAILEVPVSLVRGMAALGGMLYLETGRIGQANRVAKDHPLDDSPTDAPTDLILFHARLRSRQGDMAGALAILDAGVSAKYPARPISWVRLVLEVVRLARRFGSPRPDLAEQAHKKARELQLPGVAHEFVPFVD